MVCTDSDSFQAAFHIIEKKYVFNECHSKPIEDAIQ